MSSNFGQDPEGAFGSVNAIDDDPGTEWSSQSDGNQAWIEIELPTQIEITGFGFWTRSMGDTGQIFKVRMPTGTGEVIGEFDIPSAGNTGARQIRIYGQKTKNYLSKGGRL